MPMLTSWIWLPEAGHDRDAYARFRLALSTPAKRPVLRISAHSTFCVRLNGEVVQGSQFSDLDGHPTYSDLPLSGVWRPGRNTIEIQVYVLGRDSLTTAVVPPGLWAEVRDGAKVLARTDESWECALDTAYENGLGIPLSSQLGDIFYYDASPRHLDWRKPRILGCLNTPTPRPAAAPPLRERPAPVTQVVQAGELLRTEDNTGTAAKMIFNDLLRAHYVDKSFCTPGTEELQHHLWGQPIPFMLAPENAMRFPFTWPAPRFTSNGWYLIVDLGDEQTGWLTVTLQAEKGTVLEIAHGEHLTDGRVRAYLDGRNFADRVVCDGGLLHFTHRLRRVGARYLEMHVTNATKPPKVGYLGIVPVMRDLPKPAKISCPDRLLERLDATAIRTLALCQHEHFEDCPWREQGLYPYDSRNQALFGFPIWGNYPFVASCYKLMGDNWNDNAQTLQMTSPGRQALSIPIFGLVWVTALWELYLHSGDRELVRPMLPTVEKLIDAVLKKTLDTPQGVIYHPGKHKEIWNFCEWVPGLSGELGNEDPTDYNTPYNLYLVETLNAAAKLADAFKMPLAGKSKAELKKEAARLANTCGKLFWDDKKGLIRTNLLDATPFHEHVQILAIYNGAVKGDRLRRVSASLLNGGLVESTFSTLPYWIRTMRMLPKRFSAQILPRLRRVFEPSILLGTKTLWETEAGGEDFTFAGSLCHGWSSTPAWYTRTGLLGIEPTSPGYKTFRFRPDFQEDLEHFRGEVVTPHGTIEAEWRRMPDGSFEKQILRCPKETTPTP